MVPYELTQIIINKLCSWSSLHHNMYVLKFMQDDLFLACPTN